MCFSSYSISSLFDFLLTSLTKVKKSRSTFPSIFFFFLPYNVLSRALFIQINVRTQCANLNEKCMIDAILNAMFSLTFQCVYYKCIHMQNRSNYLAIFPSSFDFFFLIFFSCIASSTMLYWLFFLSLESFEIVEKMLVLMISCSMTFANWNN